MLISAGSVSVASAACATTGGASEGAGVGVVAGVTVSLVAATGFFVAVFSVATAVFAKNFGICDEVVACRILLYIFVH